jgi:hypothetical protein
MPRTRFAVANDQIITLAAEYHQLACRHWTGKASDADVDIFHERHDAALDAIACGPLACDEPYSDEERYRAIRNCVYPPIWLVRLVVGHRI